MISNEFNCNCFLCKNKLPFEFPKEIIDEFLEGKIVLFAGAGISTEAKEVFKQSLYEQIAEELGEKDSILTFPMLMTKYCKRKNGRALLLQFIRKRFDYAHQYPEIYDLATRFHAEVSSFWMLNTIITTNWDDYFERECAAIPIVDSKDFAFYDIPERKVIKVHGSINNYGSIVATTEDYNKCYKALNSGLIGSSLKTLLASKTIIFVGYSFSDFTFNKIYTFIKKELGDLIPHSYIITLDDTSNIKFKKFNSTVIRTDASYFFSVLKDHFVKCDLIAPDSFIDDIYESRYNLRYVRNNFVIKDRSMVKYPALVYSVAYLDGMEHAFDFLIHNSKSGLSRHYSFVIRMVDYYIDHMRPKFMKPKAYQEVAYIDGYINGLKQITYLKFGTITDIPFLYIYGYGILDNRSKFNKAVKGLKKKHKSAFALAKMIVEKTSNNDEGIIIRHRPFL